MRSIERSRIVTLRAEAERDHGRVVADHPAADDDDLAGRDAGHAAEQQAAPAERLLQEVRAGLRRQPAGDLAHRGEQRQRAVRRLDGLVRDGGDAALDQGAVSGSSAAMWRYVKSTRSVAQAPVLGLDRLLHLQQQLRFGPHFVDRGDLRPDGLVGSVGKRAARRLRRPRRSPRGRAGPARAPPQA